MKRLTFLIVICLTASFLSDTLVHAQRPGGQGQGGRPGGGGRGPGAGATAGRGGPGASQQQTPPLLRVFDADGDGEVSAAEIQNAAAALVKLDHNRDGKLTAQELRPSGQTSPRGQSRPENPRGPAGPEGTRGQDGPRGPGADQGRPGQQSQSPRGSGGGRPGGSGPGGGRPGGGGGGRGGDPGQADAAFANEVLAFDANKDGLLSLAELPEHMHKAFIIADADKDASLDATERLVLAGQFRRNKLQPTGDDLEIKNRPTQGRRP